MAIDRRADTVLEKAKRLAGTVETWADFTMALFHQFNGIVAKTFPSDFERQAFYDSDQYKQIQQMQTDLMRKFGVADGATPKSGRFVVRVPKTIHQNLDIEAKREGVSLNQLAATKLALPLPRSTGVAESIVIAAFNATHGGYSQDWVVIDPRHNGLFLARCRKLGLADREYGDFFLNHLLLNIRKTKKFQGQLNSAYKTAGYKSYDDCAFAAEIAVRTLQRTEGVTLDRILCDPELRERYDAIAAKLVTNTVIKLRSAALNLRKTHRLQPVDLTTGVYDLVTAGPLKRVSLDKIAKMPGTYVFYDDKRPIFAGETDDLRNRIGMHKSGGLPEWVQADRDEGVILKFSVLPTAKRDERLKWLGSFINQERPLLNYQKAA